MINQEKIEAAVKALFGGIQFTAEPSGLYDPLRYMIEIGGKRLRPRLCLTTYSLYKDEFCPEILEPAAGLEVFHSFTLIHDDIMDRSPLRRGVDTVWKKWSPDTAILSGDVMCIDSYSRVAKAPRKCLDEVLALFSKTAAQVCEGQQYDMEFEERGDVTMDEYMRMIGLKTGVLIACAAKMGALIGGATKEERESLYEYGYNLGLAFQVADDYLDVFGDEKVFGKPIGSDIVNSKKSWLTVRAFEKAEGGALSDLREAMAMGVGTPEEKEEKISAVRGLYQELGVGRDAQDSILRLNSRALEAARKVCDGERFMLLYDFAGRLIGRAK
ncbi:MAG: polyprenyl synthetase family protein [Bacteroidales bacterium]|nr:polyprenyl synthetase family protein [Bacteroidales bacterium]